MLPCTYLPPWWFNSIFIKNKKNKVKIKLLNKYQNNMAGMTMWLSGKLLSQDMLKLSMFKEVTQLRKYIVAKKNYI